MAATFGAVVILGVIVAPTIFHTDKILDLALLSNYSEGVIMSEIFRRFGYWLYFLAFFVFAYESYMYKQGQRDAVAFGSSVTVLFSSLMFSGIYSPKIISMQKLGVEATKSDTFKNIHLASEFDFKILAIALLILFIRRLMLLRLK